MASSIEARLSSFSIESMFKGTIFTKKGGVLTLMKNFTANGSHALTVTARRY